VAEINQHFTDPALSPGTLSRRLALSPRYINELPQESGRSFAERVLELRLQKARAMLAAPGQDRRRVSEIAYACGSGDISYFNRCFGHRFGASPTQARRGKDGD
jgi:AraC-like DNA-binding protein